MGDNNATVDQSASNISFNNLVNPERIKSVAWKEIPWLGSLKLLFNGHTTYLNNYATNSVPCLAAFFITIILSVISAGYLFDEYVLRKKKTPTP
jgi:signal peptidase